MITIPENICLSNNSHNIVKWDPPFPRLLHSEHCRKQGQLSSQRINFLLQQITTELSRYFNHSNALSVILFVILFLFPAFSMFFCNYILSISSNQTKNSDIFPYSMYTLVCGVNRAMFVFLSFNTSSVSSPNFPYVFCFWNCYDTCTFSGGRTQTEKKHKLRI